VLRASQNANRECSILALLGIISFKYLRWSKFNFSYAFS